ncbi:MAG: TonB family protein [Rudaea sp.]|uniref:TonB family protein n=1 Tax=unclassified Rudaea TaxID=2627037 RepID=UPI0010F52A3A|nr:MULTISPECIES: TonB family protein [unclassified Rudaea]MBN8885740.1 TonB family protein [Rudaea sp.]
MNVPPAPAAPRLPAARIASKRWRWERMLGFAVSLGLHLAIFAALLRPEPAPTPEPVLPAAIVSVDLTASQPTAPTLPALPIPPLRSERATAAASAGAEAPRSRTSTEPAGVAASANARTNSRAPNREVSRAPAQPAREALYRSPPARSAQDADNRARDAQSAYRRLLAEYLAKVKRYPASAVATHDEGTVMLWFRLDRSGRLLSWTISRSSQSPRLDGEVARMVQAAAPFPPFPAAWDAPSATFVVPIDFSLN